MTISDDQAISFNLDSNGSYTHSFQNKPAMSTIEGKRSLTLQLGSTPNVLKTKPDPQGHSYLNPDVIQDIVLIFFYQGEMTWS